MLPEPKLTFGHDSKALALTVAKEGYVDKTSFSQVEAVVELDLINTILKNRVGGTK